MFEGKLKFKVEKDDSADSITIKAYVDKQKVGDIIIQEVYGFEGFFEGFTTEETYIELIPDDRYLEIKSIFVDRDWRNQRISNKMLTKLFPIVKKYYPGYRDIVLWASPFSCYMGNHLELSVLKKLYEKFGFITLEINKIVDDQKFEYDFNIMTRKINLD